ncbi:MAG: GGDEF domain-containing protein [Butyrivibrio sp.]|nr:GGDEF domain-containing protein [Butyrivibrio sp.]
MTKKRATSLLCFMGLVILINCVLMLCLRYNSQGVTYPLTQFDVTLNGREYQKIDITKFYTITNDKLKKEDQIILSTRLPQNKSLVFPGLLFKSRYCTVECYVDDNLVCDYGLKRYQKHQFVGKKYHFITLPSDYEGKRLTIKMTVAEDNPFSAITPIYLGSLADLRGQFVNEHMMIIFTGMFLFVFGIAFLCISLLYISSVHEALSFLFSSLLCINLGLCLMAHYNVMPLFMDIQQETEIEYLTMYMIVPYCYVIVYFIQNIENKPLYLGAAAASIGSVLVQYLLHFVFNIHLRKTLPMYHIVGVVGFVLIMIFTYRNIKKRNIQGSGAIQMGGILILALAEVAQLIIYNLDNMHISTPKIVSMVIITTGCLVFVISQLANYLLFITQTIAQRQEYASLSHLAYADGLTNLPNRASADKLLSDLDSSEDDYCIISIDLNGLKAVNDNMGHLAGDRYIKDFAKVLTTSFEDDGFCARIGGDEFLVILRDAASKDIDGLLGRMNSALNVMNALYPEYHRSVASGYAFRHECPEGSPSHEVYLIADQRMYAIKRKMHEALGIKTRL